MRRLTVLTLALVALAPAVAHADLPVAYVGPTWFTDVDKGGPDWDIRFTGAQAPIDPSDYGTDPDGSGSSFFEFANADNAAGTVQTNSGSFPVAFTRLPKGPNSMAVVGGSPFMLAVQRRGDAAADDDFLVLGLQFAGEDLLTGTYYTCGPAAFLKNPDGLPDYGAPDYYDRFYAEGKLVAWRHGTTVQDFPASGTEVFGFFGVLGGEGPLCDQARNTPALWPADQGVTVPPPALNRRETKSEVLCNRGPNPGDPFDCTATVRDSDTRTGAQAPLGTVDLGATEGSLSIPTCELAASTGSSSICTFGYANPGVGAGNAPPVTASYRGSGNHKPSSASPVSHVGEDVNNPPSTGNPPAQVCGAAPLPACSAPPSPLQVCVANVGGACINTALGPQPLQICVGNIVNVCQGFAAGAQFAGEVAADDSAEAYVRCPAGAALETSDTGHTTRQRPDGNLLPFMACRIYSRLSAGDRFLVDQYDKYFVEEAKLRYAAAYQISKLPRLVRSKPRSYTVFEVIDDDLVGLINDHNSVVHRLNPAIEALTVAERNRLSIRTLGIIGADYYLDNFSRCALGPDFKQYCDPRLKALKIDLGPHAKGARATKIVYALKPPRRTLPTGTVTVARSAVTTVAAGKSATVKLKPTLFGRRLLAYTRAMRRRTLKLTAAIDFTVGPHTARVSKPVTAKIVAKKKKDAAKKQRG